MTPRGCLGIQISSHGEIEKDPMFSKVLSVISIRNAILKGCVEEAVETGMYRKGQSDEGDVKKGLCSDQPATELTIGSIVYSDKYQRIHVYFYAS
ncbi:hypothetical protein KPH14_006285 [Odynerus spinipes]|uniref:Uncharacterized protein n=1 Tax=Odynerus spinipes TaxID=1348599 RepID=A0AAD9RRZ6_9HYME|nr:hypothetical protein KPH14_006285 [Odynerus spinipes]